MNFWQCFALILELNVSFVWLGRIGVSCIVRGPDVIETTIERRDYLFKVIFFRALQVAVRLECVSLE